MKNPRGVTLSASVGVFCLVSRRRLLYSASRLFPLPFLSLLLPLFPVFPDSMCMFLTNLQSYLGTLEVLLTFQQQHSHLPSNPFSSPPPPPLPHLSSPSQSWVGAICDSKDPSCRGDNAIHTPLAVTFFILFNMYVCCASKSFFALFFSPRSFRFFSPPFFPACYSY